jgi:hypothetical protein
MSYTYTPTNRFFIDNPYNPQLDTDKTPFTSQQILDYITSIDPQTAEINGNIVIAEYTIDRKYKYPVIAFPHDIWTPTGKIKKSFKQSLEPIPYNDDYTPTNLWPQPYDKKSEKM